MARKPRIEYSGAFYHIIVRGNQQQDIFLDDDDRQEYLRRVAHYRDKCHFIIYAYVLMDNHVHLLIETPVDRISRIMQLINFTYTQYFNRKYHKVGHLFQGRYKGYLCDKDEYLLVLTRYIHLNPVRAGMVNRAEGYGWSSHNDYLKGQRGLISTDLLLRLFSERKSEASRLYKKFVDEGNVAGDKEGIYEVIEQQIVGDELFIDKIRKEVEEPEMRPKRPRLIEIMDAVAAEAGLAEADLVSTSRREDMVIARGVAIGLMRKCGYKLREIGESMNREISSLSKLGRQMDSEAGCVLAGKVMKRLKTYFQA
jgi:REP element-mobilizing transposase RayT